MMYDCGLADLLAIVRWQVYGGLVGFNNEYVSITTIVGKSFFCKVLNYSTGIHNIEKTHYIKMDG